MSRFANIFTDSAVNALVNAGVSYAYDMFTLGHILPVNVFGYDINGAMFAAVLNGATAFFGESIKSNLQALIPTSGRAAAVEAAILGPLGNGLTTFAVYSAPLLLPSLPLRAPGVNTYSAAAEEGFKSLAIHAVSAQVTKVGLPIFTGRQVMNL